MATETISGNKIDSLFNRIRFFAKAGNLTRANFFELDDKAIVYAKKLNSKLLSRISFFHSAIFKFNTDPKLDTIWPGVLFNYLNHGRV